MDNGLSFDGTTHFPVVTPSTVSELGGLVRQTAADQKALYPYGGRTMLDLGSIPTKPGNAIDLRQLNRIIDYPARDMTITVQTGITIGQLQEVLLAEKQRLPVDIPFPSRATLGGAVAANASGPRRFGLGTLRDYVIGISIVNDEGREAKAGGRVVKNVAGYDMMKLYTGSLGTLGIIAQVTLKLKPLPESSRLLVLPVAIENASTILDALFSSHTRPVSLDLVNPTATNAIGGLQPAWNLVIGFEDNVQAVAWQAEQLMRELPAESRDQLRECTHAEASTLWTALTDFALWPEAEFSFKANLLSRATPDFCRQAAAIAPTALVQAHAGNGIVIGHVNGLTLDRARSLLEILGALAAKANGNMTVTRCPAAWKTMLPIWGHSTGDRALMSAIKAKLDPTNIFNPGRFVDGI